MHLIWLEQAVTDLADIHDYIAQENPAAAARIAKRLFDAASSLTEFPERGRIGRFHDGRELVIRPWVIAYHHEPGDEAIFIVRILDARQNWPLR